MNIFHAHAAGRRLRRSIAVVAVAVVAAVVPVVATTVPASAATGFTVQLTPGNTYFLLLDIDGASGSPGAPLIDWGEDGGENQYFTFRPVGSYYEIVNDYSQMCLYGDGYAGDGIFQMPCGNDLPQELWATGLPPDSTQFYWIENPFSGLYMDVDGDSTSPGTQVIQWYWNGGGNQCFANFIY